MSCAPTDRTPVAVDDLVDATPASRDRFVDLVRAVSIAVVVAWHWVFSVTHWRDGRLTMPNPIDDVPLLWVATWLLQVMPLFFVVGGYANGAGWESLRRDGDPSALAFARRRLRRLYRPLVGFAVAWTAVEVILGLAVPGYPGVLHYGRVVFVPLWFLAVYTAVTLLTPATAWLHRRAGVLAVVGLGAAVALADLGRFGYGVDALGAANSLLVFVFAHQLGYLYRDGTLVAIGRRGQAALLLGGLTALVVLTSSGVYARSMVATEGDPRSNMFPTTACIAALAVVQAAAAMLVRPAAARWLERREVWRAVVAANGVAMTVYVWHMTALLVVIGAVGALGVDLLGEPTAAWWAQRPVWLVLPAAVLAGLVRVAGRAEHRR